MTLFSRVRWVAPLLGLVMAVVFAAVACAPAAPAPTVAPAKPAEPTKAAAPAAQPAAAAPSSAKYNLRIASGGAPGSYSYVAVDKLKELVESRSKGQMTVQKFEGSVGGEAEILQRIQLGTFEGYLGSTGPLLSITKANVLVPLDMPYLFKDWDRYVKALSGPYGQAINEKLSAAGFRVLAWGSLGERVIYQKTGPVTKPENLKGMKLRTMENPVYLAWYKSIGVQPVAMSFTEVYTSLQTGVIDGVDGALQNIANKMNEVAKHVTLTNHVVIGYPIIVGEKWYAGLPADLKEVVSKSAVEAAAFEHDHDVKIQNDLIAQWKAGGVTVTTPDREAFRKSAEPIWPQFADQVGKDVLDQLISANK